MFMSCPKKLFLLFVGKKENICFPFHIQYVYLMEDENLKIILQVLRRISSLFIMLLAEEVLL